VVLSAEDVTQFDDSVVAVFVFHHDSRVSVMMMMMMTFVSVTRSYTQA